MIPQITAAETVFLMTLAAPFGTAFIARRHSAGDKNDGLAEVKLNRWLVGLSAGTTANSGFIVTGAVGLGYVYAMGALADQLASWRSRLLVFLSSTHQQIWTRIPRHNSFTAADAWTLRTCGIGR